VPAWLLRLYALAPPSDEIRHPAVARCVRRWSLVPPPSCAMRRAIWRATCAAAAHAPLRYARRCARAWRGRTLRDFLRAGWLAGAMRRDGVAHLHAHFISTPADMAALAAHGGMPFSISAHAKDIYPRARDLQRRLRAARFTVTCTEANRRALARWRRRPGCSACTTASTTACSTRGRRSASGPPLLLAVGRLRAKKGLDTLIDACRLLRSRGVAFRCEIVGYGEEQEPPAGADRRARPHRPGAAAWASWRASRSSTLCAGRLFVQPSRITADGDRDGIPNVLLEAMAMGLPVVATRVSGIPEVVRHHHNGLLVEPDDAAALADAIATCCHRHPRCRQPGPQARATVTDALRQRPQPAAADAAAGAHP
jgi:glycosyltransferase involved in cell wall biosynthesis